MSSHETYPPPPPLSINNRDWIARDQIAYCAHLILAFGTQKYFAYQMYAISITQENMCPPITIKELMCQLV
jgi:hypothetical protein